MLEREYTRIKKVCEQVGCAEAKVTMIATTKRHDMRLFTNPIPMDRRDANIKPGTVVDTMVVANQDFQFYLCSHAAPQVPKLFRIFFGVHTSVKLVASRCCALLFCYIIQLNVLHSGNLPKFLFS